MAEKVYFSNQNKICGSWLQNFSQFPANLYPFIDVPAFTISRGGFPAL